MESDLRLGPSTAAPPARASLPVRAYRGYALAAGCLQSLFLFAVRVRWGWQFFETGKGKLGNLDKVAGYFKTLDIPAPKLNAILAATTECVGGLLLLVGLGGRLVSLPLAFTMLVAFWTAERADIHSMDDFEKAAPYLFLMASVIILCFGPGKISIDYLLERFVFKRNLPLRPDGPSRSGGDRR